MHRRLIPTDGLTQSILEAGSGPLVLLLHGFPELAVSWRAQLPSLAKGGFHAVAPDMRGYGGTDKPEAREAHTILHLVGDMVDLVRALGEERCVVVGHDFGASVAWHCALMRPDVFTAACNPNASSTSCTTRAISTTRENGARGPGSRSRME